MTTRQKTRGQICFSQEFCTNCPERKNCKVRPLFYSDKQYEEYWTKTLNISKQIAISMQIPKNVIPIGLDLGKKMMDKRRKKELELHPTYSND